LSFVELLAHNNRPVFTDKTSSSIWFDTHSIIRLTLGGHVSWSSSAPVMGISDKCHAALMLWRIATFLIIAPYK